MKYFGTDGIRGIYGKNLTERLAYRAALGATQYLGGECFVAMDTRVSGEALCTAVVSGLTQGGCNVKFLGVLPTPAVSFLAAKYGAGGIMISASHNPPEYNGLKFFTPKGYKFSSYHESAVEEFIDHPPARIGGGTVTDYEQGKEEYIDYVTKNAGDLSGKEVTLDCAFGAAACVAEEAFSRCGAKVRVLSGQCDGTKINCDVGALHPGFIAKYAQGLGFAFDGDADRLAVASGGEVDGDSVLYNLSILLNPVGVVGTILNNTALECALKERGISFIRTAVGDKNIGDAMRRYGFTLGGEQSGHFIISPSVSGDALKAALLLSGLNDIVRLRLVPQKGLSIRADKKILSDAKFIKIKEQCEKRIGDGRIVVRMSGTEPKIRLMAESKNEQLADEVISTLAQAICESGGSI